MVPISLTIRAPKQSIVLTQTGLLFTAVVGGGAGPPQGFGIANSGEGAMNWRVAATKLSGDTNWLRVAPQSGSTVPGQIVPEAFVTVDVTGLASGVYYGQMTVFRGSRR